MKYPEIAKRFEHIMKLRHLKQVDLVNKTGISKASINQYVKGIHCPENDRAVILANALRVDPMWLMGFDVPMEKPSVEIADINYDKSKSREAKVIALYDSLPPSQQALVDNLLETLVSKQ